MEQQIGRADPCYEAREREITSVHHGDRGIFYPQEFVIPSGRRYFNFNDWRQSIAGQWFEKFCESADQLKSKNILYFDFEYLTVGDDILPRLACWFESCPPKSIGNCGVAKMNSDVNRRAFLRALYRADIIVGYNLFTLDIRALDHWGFDVQANLLKFIDPYQFFFKYVSDYQQGSLGDVSVLNGGPTKYVRNGVSNNQFVKQCQRDVEMLRHVFDRMLSGQIETSLLGKLDQGMIWKDVQDPVTRRPRGPSPSVDGWSSVCIEYCLSVGFEGRCVI